MKKVISVLLVLIMVLPLILSLATSSLATAQARANDKSEDKALHIKKVVSVVYDNAESMRGTQILPVDRYKYASYAMQAFCGMLNSDDKLYITYTATGADIAHEQKLGNNDDFKASLESIRNHEIGSGTSYMAVETAYGKLVDEMNNPSNDDNTQYWLVLITDGGFDGVKENGAILKGEALENYVNNKFAEYVEPQANGKKLQIAYMGVGKDDELPKIEAKEDLGIYSYQATESEDMTESEAIVVAMNQMADKISGRKRVESDAQSLSGDKKSITFTSKIPLSNIVVFVQNTDAIVDTASSSGGVQIIKAREARLESRERTDCYGDPTKDPLEGSIYLLEGTEKTMGAGEYTINFDKEISLDNVAILFEPAVELRAKVMLNGKEITDLNNIGLLMETDKISLSYELYETGTDNLIDTTSLENTTYEIFVYEDGEEKAIENGQSLTDYVVSAVETKILARVSIEGFKPIEFVFEFTPIRYVSNYTIVPSFGSDTKCVLKEDVSKNEDVQVCFTILADGTPITDPEVVKALNPVIETSIKGNDGEITYAQDGKIVFTPKTASARPGNEPVFDVTVTCSFSSVRGEASASEKYQVDASTFEVVYVPTDKTIKKTELYGNEIYASFQVLKEGVKLNKSEVGEEFKVTFNKMRDNLIYDATVSDDGTIMITPKSEKEHKKGFFLTYWLRYFTLNGTDITITLEHVRGTATGTLDVVGGSGAYVFFNVLLWLIIEILVVLMVIAYIIRYMSKPRFSSDAVLYVGNITRNSNGTHELVIRSAVSLKKYNKFSNLWNPFKKDLSVNIRGVRISAARGNKIVCNENKRYADSIIPKDRSITINHPKDVIAHCRNNGELIIHEIKTDTILAENNKTITCSDSVYYFTRARIEAVRVGVNEIEAIEGAVAFCYTIDTK